MEAKYTRPKCDNHFERVAYTIVPNRSYYNTTNRFVRVCLPCFKEYMRDNDLIPKGLTAEEVAESHSRLFR